LSEDPDPNLTGDLQGLTRSGVLKERRGRGGGVHSPLFLFFPLYPLLDLTCEKCDTYLTGVNATENSQKDLSRGTLLHYRSFGPSIIREGEEKLRLKERPANEKNNEDSGQLFSADRINKGSERVF
jgi:hypothetical protein